MKTYAGKPTHAARITEYLEATPFKQMAIARIAADLDMTQHTINHTLSDMAQAGRITRGKNGRMSIIRLSQK